LDFDVLIIGAGVIGLATAEIFSRNKYSVLVVEKENRIGTGVSSRNSEVIHAGIYYPKDSLKSVLCIKGKHLLYNWCEKNHVSCKKTGKYIIATNDEEFEKLEIIKKNASQAEMEDLYFVSADEIRKEEPDIFSVGGLFSPTSGIVSAHELMDSFKKISERNGANFLFLSRVKSIKKNSQSTGYYVEIIDSTNQALQIEVGIIINCAGLYADQVAKSLGAFNDSYNQKFDKGNYFKLTGHKFQFKHLIYPVPLPRLRGLGVHVTLSLNYDIKFGPDVETLPEKIEDYTVSENKKQDFYEAIKSYLPSIGMDDIIPEMAGIRPRLAANKEFNDFIINEETEKGYPDLINCIGIESPGLTASLAIAEHIYTKLLNF
jgi:L-2-hydroxyglutarate oxidase LhgO